MVPVPIEPGNERAGWGFEDVPGLVAFYPASAAEPPPPPPPPALGWNPAAAAAGYVALSLLDKRADGLAGGATYVAANSETTHALGDGGKFYFEVDFVGGTIFGTNIPPAIGLGGPTDSTAGSLTLSPCYVMAGAKSFGGAARPACSAGDNIGVAADFDTGEVWLRKNGTWVNGGDPAAGTLPDYAAGSLNPLLSPFRVVAMGNQSGVATTYAFLARFGTDEFVYAAPAGFEPWG